MKFAGNWPPVDLDQEDERRAPIGLERRPGAFIAILKKLRPRLRDRRLVAWSPWSKQNKGADQQTHSKGAGPQGADGNDTHEDAKSHLVLGVCHLMDVSRHWRYPARASFGTPRMYTLNRGQGEALASIAIPMP